MNEMPEDPAEQMRDYISTHFFYEKKIEDLEGSTYETEEEKEARLRKDKRVKDLEDLK